MRNSHTNTGKIGPDKKPSDFSLIVIGLVMIARPAIFLASAISVTFTAMFIGSTLAEDGFSIVDVVATIGVSLALMGGVVTLHHIGFKVLPYIEPRRKGKIVAVWLAAAIAFASVSCATSLLWLAEPAAKAAHLEGEVSRLQDDADRILTTKGRETSLIPQLETVVKTSADFALKERAQGAISEDGAGLGRTAAQLESLTNVAEATLDALLRSRGQAEPLIRRVEELRKRLRSAMENEGLTKDERNMMLRQSAVQLHQGTVSLNRSIPLAALRSAVDAFARDWRSMGLPQPAVTKMAAYYGPLAQRLGDEVAALEEATFYPVRAFSQPEGFEVIGEEIETVWPLVITAVLLEFIPIAIVLLILVITARPRPGA